jgi:hypothetical protein
LKKRGGGFTQWLEALAVGLSEAKLVLKIEIQALSFMIAFLI